MNRRKWTPEEDEWLTRHYSNTSVDECAKNLRRSVGAVYSKAFALRLGKLYGKDVNEQEPRFTDADIINIAAALAQSIQVKLLKELEATVRDMTMDEAVGVLAATVVDLAGRNLAVLMDTGYSVPTALDAIRELAISNYKEMHRTKAE